MLKSALAFSKKSSLSLLLLGAHCDDIEIGSGGTILRLLQEYNVGHIKWVVFTSNEDRKKEALASAKRFLEDAVEFDIEVHDFKDGYLPASWTSVKDAFEKIKNSYKPDVIFTHYRNDLHQDHRLINEFTWNTFRHHLILEYEIPKYDGDLGNPNVFIPMDKKTVKRKNEIILSSFKSQLKKQWLDEQLLTSMLRLRGMECASDSHYAEAFYCRKMTL